MNPPNQTITVVGGGLAGSECAFQLAEMGHNVVLYEMRGVRTTPAHKTNDLAELVCSNSFGSTTDYSAPGQLKWEAEKMGSLILAAGQEAAVPAGMALGVDREKFSAAITKVIQNHPRITIKREVIQSLDDVPRPAVIATGPLTDEPLAMSMRKHFDDEFLYFFDAIAPVIETDSIDKFVAFKADRWDKGTKDYYNCPLNKEQYFNLINEIKNARKIESKEFEKTPYFESCMPIEAIVERGDNTLRFGPMSPKGILHPVLREKYYAVVQLRQENKEGTAYNMVGFQTKMAYGEQVRVFRMIPGLTNAEFLKLGSIHRNLYIQSPKKLTDVLSSRKRRMAILRWPDHRRLKVTSTPLALAYLSQDFLNDKNARPYDFKNRHGIRQWVRFSTASLRTTITSSQRTSTLVCFLDLTSRRATRNSIANDNSRPQSPRSQVGCNKARQRTLNFVQSS